MIMAAGAASATLPAETFTAGDWELTGGGNAAITLSYKGRKLLTDVTVGGWTEGYKRGTFGGRGYLARREGDTVTFSKTGPNANVTLAVTLAKGRAAFAMDVDVLKEFGPVEYGFNVPVDSFAGPDGSAWPMVDKTFCLRTQVRVRARTPSRVRVPRIAIRPHGVGRQRLRPPGHAP